MLKKRVIFTLLYDAGAFMLSRNFRLQRVGDLRWLQRNYNFAQIAFAIDERIILDVTRGTRDEDKFSGHIRSLTEECFVPISAGGGIRSLEQARRLLRSGADKIVLNSVLSTSPTVVSEIAAEFGRQCVIAAVDVKEVAGYFTVCTENGAVHQGGTLAEWLRGLTLQPVGELYLNSIDRDGTGQGYQLELLDCLPQIWQLPVIIAGGAGRPEHLAEGLMDSRVDAVATAHLFNFVGNGLEKARSRLLENGFSLASWRGNSAQALKGIFSH